MAVSSYVAVPGTFEFSRMHVLRKSMLLLGGAVGAAMAACAFWIFGVGYTNNILSLVAIFSVFGISFFIHRFNDDAVGYALVIGSGFLLGTAATPTILYFLLAGKGAVVVQALVSTFVLFVLMGTLSFFTNIDFTRLVPFFSISFLCLFIVSLLNLFFFHSSFASLIISYGVAAISCGFIAARLNAVARGGEPSAVLLSFGLLIDVYNLFMSLLRILSSRD